MLLGGTAIIGHAALARVVLWRRERVIKPFAALGGTIIVGQAALAEWCSVAE